MFVQTEHKGAPHIGCPFSFITSHFSLITSHLSLAKRFFASRSRLVCSVRRALPLRARGLRAPWLASAVRVTLDVSAAKLLHCHCGSRIQPSVSHLSLLTYHFSLITHHFSLITSHSSLLTSSLLLVIWSFGHLSKSKTDAVKTATII